MLAPKPTFSIIIPTFNRADVVETTLRHLDRQEYPPDLYEVIVADNSTDLTPDMVERMQIEVRFRLRLLRTSEWHPALKRNRAIALADREIVLFLNDDVWVTPTFLAEHAQSHAAHAPRPVAVLGHVAQSSKMPYSPFTEFHQPYAYGELADKADLPVKWWYFYTPNVSVPRSVLIERGLLFREHWPEIAHDDIELGYRWTRAGYDLVYNPRAWGEHYHPHSLRSACRQQEGIGRSLPDFQRVVSEPRLLERYGVFDWSNSPHAIARGLLRKAMFNAATVPMALRWLEAQQRNTRLTRWMYWKVLLHYTNRGYRQVRAGPRPVGSAPTRAQAARR